MGSGSTADAPKKKRENTSAWKRGNSITNGPIDAAYQAAIDAGAEGGNRIRYRYHDDCVFTWA
jgi:hypothetical protein